MEKTASYTPPDGVPMPRRLGAIVAVAFGVGLSVLDATIVNVALPTLSLSLGITSADSIWIVNAYQLATIVALLPLSALGDSLGYRRVYVAGLALFTAASALCALAGSLPVLVAGRILQGLGAAAVTSVNTTLIRIIYPRAQLGRGMGINATVVAVASVAGPTAAGALLSAGDWPWLFAVNLPVGAAACVLARRFLPDNPAPAAGRGRTFGWADAALNALTFGCMMLSVEGLSHGADGRAVAAGLAVASLAGWRFVRRQRRQERPLLPLDLLRIPIFSLSLLTSVCSYFAQMLAMVALPFYLQYDCGYDAVRTGLLLTAWPAVVTVAAPVAGALVGRVHAGVLGGAGLALLSAGLLALALMPEAPAAGAIVWRLMVCGVGFALFQSPNNSLLIASAPGERSGSASGMLAMARLTGQTAGAGAMALLFHLVPSDSTRAALVAAALCAAAASVAGFSRLRLPLPEALRRRG